MILGRNEHHFIVMNDVHQQSRIFKRERHHSEIYLATQN
jgi:hypothetical protein